MNYPSEPLTVLGQPLLRLDPPFGMQRNRPASGGSVERSRRAAGIGARSPLDLRQNRSRVKLILLGDPDAVDQNVIELERRGYCDSYAWTPPLIVRENAPPIQPLPGELMRLYQRWYPVSGLRLPL